jgi:carbamoyltransferase
VAVHVLGISAFYHDAAAALVSDGEIVAAAQEERFSRKKHDPRFPRHAINYCLEEAFIEADELAAVVFYDNPALSFDRVMKSLLSVAPRGEEQWMKFAPGFLSVKPFVTRYVRDMLKTDVPVLFTRHHLSHAASAFYPSPFERAAILSIDGVGEWATTSLAVGEDDEIRVLKEIKYPHSLGLLYSAFTYFCGFKVNSGEYKLMGLAPYGVPRYADEVRQLIHTKADGSFRLAMEYLGYLDSNRMTNERFHALFGGPPREPETRITRREIDIAASIQKVTEEVILGLARHAREITDSPNLCLAGGVALNCVANGLLQRTKIFDRLWIQPAAGDAGGALGSALVASYRRFSVPRRIREDGRDAQQGSYLGPSYSTREIKAFLDRHGYPYEVMADRSERANRIAGALAKGQVVGFFSGRMEFGPRSLGARSILGDPRKPETQTVMNLKIKYRESFRPFAPSVLEEHCRDAFDLDVESPYMLLVAPVRPDRRLPMDRSAFDEGDDDLMGLVRQPRSHLPAVTHVDFSARVQTVNRETHPDFHSVLEAFERQSGCAVVVNTSFNVRGEPIVCSPKDAYRCFMRTEMDLLVLEDCILEKEKQGPVDEDDSWRQEYELD